MRRLPVLLVASAVVLASLYTGYWFTVAHSLQGALEPWAESQRAHGFAVAWRTADIEGFPFAIRLRLTDATWQAAQPFPYSAHGAVLVLDAAPWNLRRWHFDAPQGVAAEEFVGAVGMSAGAVDGTVQDGDDGTVIALKAEPVTGSGAATGAAASSLDLRLTLPGRTPQSDRDPFVSLDARLADVSVPQAPPPFSQRFDALSLKTTVRGPIPAAPLPSALTRWRDAGGALDIESAHVAWDKTKVDIDGTLALDGAMQPEGALTATITGGDTIIDAIVAAGGLDPRYAGVAKSVLRAVAEPNPDGSETLHVPMSLQDQRVYIGPARVAALPHFTWR
jgi:hypothetical protein